MMLKKWTTWSIIIGVLLVALLSFHYYKGELLLVSFSIPLDFKTYFSFLLAILGFTLGAFKFFYVLELKTKHSEVTRIKSYYYNAIKWEAYGTLINLSDDELIEKYNNDSSSSLKTAEKSLNNVKLHTR